MTHLTLRDIFKDPIMNLKVGDNVKVPFSKRFLWGTVIGLIEANGNEIKDEINPNENKFLWKRFQQDYWKKNYNREVISDWIIEVKNMTDIIHKTGLFYPLDVVVDFKLNTFIRKQEEWELWDCEKSSRMSEMGTFRYHVFRWWIHLFKRRILHKKYGNF